MEGQSRTPTALADVVTAWPKQPNRSHRGCRAKSAATGTTGRSSTPEVGSRPGSSASTPQAKANRFLTSDGVTLEHAGSRAPSGSETPEPLRGKTSQLTSAQLESASKKLSGIEALRPRIRTGWGPEGTSDEVACQRPERSSERRMPQVEDFWQRELDIGSPQSSVGSPAHSSGRAATALGFSGIVRALSPSSPKGAREGHRRRPHQKYSAGGSSPTSAEGPGDRPHSRGSHASRRKEGPGEGTIIPRGTGGSSSSSSSTARPGSGSVVQRHPREQLWNGSRDDSFLSTISESTRSTESSSDDASKINVLDGSQIEVFSECHSNDHRGVYLDVLKDFRQVFQHKDEGNAEELQQLLRHGGFDKPLEMQRRIIPLIMSAFSDEQKSFIIVQGAPQCGKTSALALGILGGVGAEMPGIRAVVLSTGSVRDFKKCVALCDHVHPLRLTCFDGAKRKVSFEGVETDAGSPGATTMEDMQHLTSALHASSPAMIFGHPSRVLPLLQEAPSRGVNLSSVQVLALDDAEEAIRQGLIDEVCEVCTILRHFSKQRLRHIVLSHFLSNEAKSMVRCLRNSLIRQQNLFGIRAHRTQARAKRVNHYYTVAPRQRWPAMLAVLHHTLSLPSGIIFDDASHEARAHTRVALRALGVTASVWNALHEQGSGARAAAQDARESRSSGHAKSPTFHIMPSDLVVLKVDLPQVRCMLHFEVPRRELSIYGLRLMCLEQQDQKKHRKSSHGGKSLSVLFVEEAEVVRELEKTFHIRMHEVPTEMMPS